MEFIDGSQIFNSEKLKVYYQECFPFDSLYKWLSKGKKEYFEKREFSVTLKNEIYIRYLSFSNKDEFKNEIIRFCPEKIDIGAHFNYKPKDNKIIASGELKAVEREFVIDIDMTDYDDVRNCCKDTNVCGKCWKLIAVAMEIVDTILKDDFGFKHLIWIFSGRRGVHCWVSDEEVCKLSQVARSAIIDYISLVKGGANKNKKVFLSAPMHPSIVRSKNTLLKKFRDYFESQEFFKDPAQVEKILSLLPLADDHQQISKNMLREILLNADFTEQEKWKKILEALNITNKDNDKENLPLFELIFQYMYPRLDINVSKTLNHLLKSPFCVHPKTGKICVPIEIKDAYEFDPENVPTLNGIVEKVRKNESNEDEITTQWKDYLNTFNKYIDETNK